MQGNAAACASAASSRGSWTSTKTPSLTNVVSVLHTGRQEFDRRPKARRRWTKRGEKTERRKAESTTQHQMTQERHENGDKGSRASPLRKEENESYLDVREAAATASPFSSSSRSPVSEHRGTLTTKRRPREQIKTTNMPSSTSPTADGERAEDADEEEGEEEEEEEGGEGEKEGEGEGEREVLV
ncbi:hypothetical protein TGPRC2_425430 [Toxoplasma gondii TgCatPRC2]|uniref:Uncharacterized protein n=1 Tax=Toxoplasma gondii TgCatPRC2 TaxID=1130821 RepID=A0A151HBG8_TOXGO|nr:hypothetical protein TGPRC2_425430 [Toxoplasma gondii TgCatPRC2]